MKQCLHSLLWPDSAIAAEWPVKLLVALRTFSLSVGGSRLIIVPSCAGSSRERPLALRMLAISARPPWLQLILVQPEGSCLGLHAPGSRVEYHGH